MPTTPKPPPSALGYRSGFSVPVIGMEAEFETFLDGEQVAPEEIWSAPADFIGSRVLKRATRASQLPTGGAIYFDSGVIELVTPVIELEPDCTSRMVRSLWEQIGFVRLELDRWSAERSVDIRLRGFSAHYNVSFELPREERNRNRTIQKLALLLAHILPIPLIVVAANRRSSGIGVRPRRDRIEVTLDFTPDPGLMLAASALIVGIVREVMTWNSYRLEELDSRALPRLATFEPGRHTSRKGWLARAEQFETNPFTAPIDESAWRLGDGRTLSFRQLALEITHPFRKSILDHSDAFSTAVLFAVLDGRLGSLLDLPSRPVEYDDIGRAAKWGSAIEPLGSYAALLDNSSLRRTADAVDLGAPWTKLDTERRATGRDGVDRRAAEDHAPAADEKLPRSQYEQTFIRLVSGDDVRLGGRLLRPSRMKGWYHASLIDLATREEVVVPIEELVRANVEWIAPG